MRCVSAFFRPRRRAGDNEAFFDLNADGLVNQTDHEIWVRDLKVTWFGDANLDLEFNSADLVAIFSAGEYEDNLVQNSVWATGDWNGDAEFNSSDLVVAFTDGGYELGPRPAGEAVPEPSACLLGLLAVASLLGYRRR